MVEAAAPSAPQDSPNARAVRLKRLHSLSGVVPLGAFVVLHVWVTSSIASSSFAYDRQIGWLHGGWFLGLLEVVLIVVPLAYHALYGVWLSLQPRDPDHAYDTDLMVSLERASGIVVLVFIAAHLWEFRVQTWSNALPVTSYSSKLVEDLSSTQSGVPWIAIGYLVGIAATCFHLANGMTSFCTTWGYTRTARARRRARVLFRVAGALLFVVSCGIVLQLATGIRYFPSDEPRAPLCGSAATVAIAPLPVPARSVSSAAPSSSAPGSPSNSAPSSTPLPSTP